MPNWITINDIAGEALFNLDSGLIVQRVVNLDHRGKSCGSPEYRTIIWSLNNGDRYLQCDEKTFDRIQESIQHNTTIDYYSKINDIRWTHRVSNCFHAHGIERISDLVTKTETDLLKMHYFGTGCLSEVIRNLADHNLTLSE